MFFVIENSEMNFVEKIFWYVWIWYKYENYNYQMEWIFFDQIIHWMICIRETESNLNYAFSLCFFFVDQRICCFVFLVWAKSESLIQNHVSMMTQTSRKLFEWKTYWFVSFFRFFENTHGQKQIDVTKFSFLSVHMCQFLKWFNYDDCIFYDRNGFEITVFHAFLISWFFPSYLYFQNS